MCDFNEIYIYESLSFGERQNDTRLVTGGADGDGV